MAPVRFPCSQYGVTLPKDSFTSAVPRVSRTASDPASLTSAHGGADGAAAEASRVGFAEASGVGVGEASSPCCDGRGVAEVSCGGGVGEERSSGRGVRIRRRSSLIAYAREAAAGVRSALTSGAAVRCTATAPNRPGRAACSLLRARHLMLSSRFTAWRGTGQGSRRPLRECSHGAQRRAQRGVSHGGGGGDGGGRRPDCGRRRRGCGCWSRSQLANAS